MSIFIESFAGQNWLITPAALAVNETPPRDIVDQNWLLVLTGVCIANLQGNDEHGWRWETLTIEPAIKAPLSFVIDRYSVPVPTGPMPVIPVINLEQWAPFSAISSMLDIDTGGGGVDAGFAVDTWRPTPFLSYWDVNNNPVNQIFRGIDVDVAVRNNNATLYRISYHITLVGKIVFLYEDSSLHLS